MYTKNLRSFQKKFETLMQSHPKMFTDVTLLSVWRLLSKHVTNISFCCVFFLFWTKFDENMKVFVQYVLNNTTTMINIDDYKGLNRLYLDMMTKLNIVEAVLFLDYKADEGECDCHICFEKVGQKYIISMPCGHKCCLPCLVKTCFYKETNYMTRSEQYLREFVQNVLHDPKYFVNCNLNKNFPR